MHSVATNSLPVMMRRALSTASPKSGVNIIGRKSAQMTQRLLEDCGCRVPVFCGPMYPGSNPELVAAVSKAGGLGIVQPLSLTHLYGHDFREGLRLIKATSGNQTFGVNFTILPNKRYQKMMDEWMDISIEEGVKFFLTSLGKPDPIVKRAHENGIKVYHDVHNVELARRAAGAGVDGLNLLNSDMGGQTGSKDAEQFIDEISQLNLGREIPLVCAGGVGDEEGFLRMLDLGYAGVQMGTRFLATAEARVTNSYKNAIVRANRDSIVRTNKLAGTESSVIRTPMIEKGGLRTNALSLLRQPATKGYARMYLLTRAVQDYKKAAFDESFEIWQAGKGVDGIHAVESVREIIDRFKKHMQSS